jgi:hypothetical protein
MRPAYRSGLKATILEGDICVPLITSSEFQHTLYLCICLLQLLYFSSTCMHSCPKQGYYSPLLGSDSVLWHALCKLCLWSNYSSRIVHISRTFHSIGRQYLLRVSRCHFSWTEVTCLIIQPVELANCTYAGYYTYMLTHASCRTLV